MNLIPLVNGEHKATEKYSGECSL